MIDVTSLAAWATRNLAVGQHPARVEVGAELLAALKATAPPPEDDDDDRDEWRLPYHRLMGLPLFENDELAPFGWRTLDRDGRELRRGERI